MDHGAQLDIDEGLHVQRGSDEQGRSTLEPLPDQGCSAPLDNPFDNVRSDLVRVAYRLLRRRDDARDLVADFETKYLESPNRLGFTSSKSTFKNWATASVRNKARSYLTKMANRSRLLHEQADQVAPASHNVPLGLEEQLDLKRAVHKILTSLDQESRAIVVMFYVERLSVAEIAAELGKEPEYVKGKLRRVRKWLRDNMKHLVH